MRVRFQGQLKADEASESLQSVMRMFRDRYGVHDFASVELDLKLLNEEGEEIEIVDATTSEVLEVFEVHRSASVINPGGSGSIH